MKKRSVWISWIVILLLLTACAGGSPPGEVTSQAEPSEAALAITPTPSPTPDSSQLACETGGYACSLDEMNEATFTRAIDLTRDAQARMRGGDSAFEVAEWLGAQAGVVVEVTDGRAILYRVEGSVPVVVEHPGVEESSRGPARYVPSVQLPALPAVTHYSQTTISEPTDVVGSQREDRNAKRALVLAPYQWQVGVYGDGVVAAAMLGSTRWYKDRVTYISNEQQSDQSVTVEHFMGWDQYDTIHVNTHGKSLCPEDDPCATYLMTGQRIGRGDLDEFVTQHPEIRGVGIGIRDRGEQVELVVFGDFFRNYYEPGSLQNKVIYFSACEILAQSDVLAALTAAAENSDLFAWTYSVKADDALAAVSALYERMAKQGQSAADAYERVPDGIKNNRPSHAAEYETYRYYGVETNDEGQVQLIDRTQTTNLLHYTIGTETNHVREVITLLNPESKATLEPGAVYPITGTLGDGKSERIELMFRVEGYTGEEIQNEDLTISFLLDGEPFVSYRGFLPADDDHLEVEAEGEFSLLVQFEEIEIPDQQPASEVTFRAELNLPGGASSVHEVDPVRAGQRDVRATFDPSTLLAGQSYTVALDRDSQVARVDVTAEGQAFTLFYDQATGRTYFPNLQGGGYMYWDSSVGSALVAPLRPVEWHPRQLEEGGFTHEPYACGEEQCDRYRAQQQGYDMVLSYDQHTLLVTLEISGPEGSATVRYEYSPVELAAPDNAVVAPAPIPFQGPGVPMPTLP